MIPETSYAMNGNIDKRMSPPRELPLIELKPNEFIRQV
jgi:hypothetical protein